jgi:nucleoside-diphosphate-sugar epimerase
MGSNEVVALTGANGSLGAVVLEHLVSQGQYKVNVILRSFAKSKSFLEQRYPKAAASGQLTFTEISDMTVPGVFDEVLALADKLIHVATPLAVDNFEEKVLIPATKIMDNVLYGAKKSPRTKRVIITGSVVSVVDMPSIAMTKEAATGRTFTPADYNPITREHAEDNGSNAYAYVLSIPRENEHGSRRR